MSRGIVRRAGIGMMAAAALFLGSCGDGELMSEQHETTEITLSWWGNDIRNEYTLDAVRRFEEAYPEIKVKCSYTEWSGYETRNRIRMISGTETDVMQINVGWLSQYSPDGSGYYDLEKLSDTLALDNFSDDMLDHGRRNGVLNAIPIAMNAETVYINKTVYDSYGLPLPVTWDDLFEAAKKMSVDGIYPLSGADKSLWLYCIAYGEQVSGKHFLGENSKINFGADDLRNMIEFYERLVNENVIPKTEDFKRYGFNDGSYAGVIAWVSDALNYCGEAIENGSEVKAVDYPVISGTESGVGWYAKPASLYAISRNTGHPHEAALLLDFMLNSSEWAELQGIEKGIPVSRSARECLEKRGQLTGLQYEASLVMENNSNISPMDSVIENGDLYDSFIRACDLVLFGRCDPETAAAKLYYHYAEKYTFDKGRAEPPKLTAEQAGALNEDETK